MLQIPVAEAAEAGGADEYGIGLPDFRLGEEAQGAALTDLAGDGEGGSFECVGRFADGLTNTCADFGIIGGRSGFQKTEDFGIERRARMNDAVHAEFGLRRPRARENRIDGGPGLRRVVHAKENAGRAGRGFARRTGDAHGAGGVLKHHLRRAPRLGAVARAEDQEIGLPDKGLVDDRGGVGIDRGVWGDRPGWEYASEPRGGGGGVRLGGLQAMHLGRLAMRGRLADPTPIGRGDLHFLRP